MPATVLPRKFSWGIGQGVCDVLVTLVGCKSLPLYVKIWGVVGYKPDSGCRLGGVSWRSILRWSCLRRGRGLWFVWFFHKIFWHVCGFRSFRLVRFLATRCCIWIRCIIGFSSFPTLCVLLGRLQVSLWECRLVGFMSTAFLNYFFRLRWFLDYIVLGAAVGRTTEFSYVRGDYLTLTSGYGSSGTLHVPWVS